MRSSIRTATRGMRIMSADVVPGVAKSARNGGGQVTQKLTPTAAAGADRLKQMVAQQAAAKKNAVIEAQLAHEEQEALDALVGKTLDRRATIADLRGALDGCIDGQKLGKDVVARALRRRRMLLDDGERPLRLLFAGPSGVGKTAMATALCEAVFGAAVPDRNFKRFNLSEYSHPSKFNRLTGGDPNYVGYKEGGELTNFIRQAEERRAGRKSAVSHTSCVVLLDEVDRAADGLLTFLMNFLDQGQLTDGRGDTVDARRAIIVMTTNVGTDTIAALEGADDALLDAEAGDADYAAYAGSGQSLQDAVVERIRGDVLEHVCDGRWENLGRLGNIVPFLPLDGAGRRSVIDRQLTALADRAAKADPPLALRGYSTALLDHVAAHWDAKLGGRSTRDYIEEHVVEAVAEALDGAPKVLDGATPIEAELDVVGKAVQVLRLDGDDAGGAEASE